MEELMKRIESAESKIISLEAFLNCPLTRVKRDLFSKKVYSASFFQVSNDYYEKSLATRATMLKCNVQSLCKSILFENTAWSNDEIGSVGFDITNSQFYLIIVQYQAKFDAELLRDFVHGLRKPENRLPRKRFHFQLAQESVSNSLSGFYHNAISPFGLLTDIPVVICRRCINIQPPYLIMGGGNIDMKLGISVNDFLRSTGAIVSEISVPRNNEIND